MKHISLFVLIAIFLVTSTYALYVDTEESIDNSFITGLIDLEVNGENNVTLPVIIDETLQSDQVKYYNITLHLVEDTNPGHIWVHIYNVTDHDGEGGGQGCTPGFWKQTQHFPYWPAPYTPELSFADIFEDAFPDMTLVTVLRLGGGGLNALGRHTVAALLNAASSDVNYTLTVDEIIALFNDYYPANETVYEQLKDTFEALNEQGCPLGRSIDGSPLCDCDLSEKMFIDMILTNTSSGESFTILDFSEQYTLRDIECSWIHLSPADGIGKFIPCINYNLTLSVHTFEWGSECFGKYTTFDIEFYAEQYRNNPNPLPPDLLTVTT